MQSVMDIGRSKLGRTMITMERKSGKRVELEETKSEKDLGVVIIQKAEMGRSGDAKSHGSFRYAKTHFCSLECSVIS